MRNLIVRYCILLFLQWRVYSAVSAMNLSVQNQCYHICLESLAILAQLLTTQTHAVSLFEAWKCVDLKVRL
jgi:hypothetical protein